MRSVILRRPRSLADVPVGTYVLATLDPPDGWHGIVPFTVVGRVAKHGNGNGTEPEIALSYPSYTNHGIPVHRVVWIPLSRIENVLN